MPVSPWTPDPPFTPFTPDTPDPPLTPQTPQAGEEEWHVSWQRDGKEDWRQHVATCGSAGSGWGSASRTSWTFVSSMPIALVAAPALVSTAPISEPPPQGMERPPAHWGDPRIYELRGSYWWCTLCWKRADDMHVPSVKHRKNATYYSRLHPPDVGGDLPSGAGLPASASSTLFLAPQSSADDAPPAASSPPPPPPPPPPSPPPPPPPAAILPVPPADDVCPDVPEIQWNAMHPEYNPAFGTNPGKTSRLRTGPLTESEEPPTERNHVQAPPPFRGACAPLDTTNMRGRLRSPAQCRVLAHLRRAVLAGRWRAPIVCMPSLRAWTGPHPGGGPVSQIGGRCDRLVLAVSTGEGRPLPRSQPR